MANINIDLEAVIKAAAQVAASTLAKNQNNSMTKAEIPAATKTIVAQMKPAVEKEASSIIENATNQEPLIQSRNMWTFALMLVGMAASAAGYAFTAEDQAAATETLIELAKVVPIITTSLLALWGMWNRIFVASKKPLGS